jgi:hypothetical protein
MNPNLPAGETMSDGDDSGAESNVTLPASAFATTPKEGQRLTFCVTGADEDGVAGYWMADDEEETQESYDDGMRESMREASKPQGAM